MVLKARSKIIQSPNSKTQYITIPSLLVSDSQYPFKANQNIEIIIISNKKKIEITISEKNGGEE